MNTLRTLIALLLVSFFSGCGGGNGYDGEVVGVAVKEIVAPTAVHSFDKAASGEAGVRGKAMVFTGTDTSLVLPALTINGSPFSIRFWLRTDTDKYAQMLIANYVPCSNSPEGFSLALYGSKLKGVPALEIVLAGKNTIDEGCDELVDGEWHHLVLSFDAEVCSIYLDGVKRMRIDLAYQATELPLHVGSINSLCDQKADQAFEGSLDELAVFDYALTDEDVRIDFDSFEK